MRLIDVFCRIIVPQKLHTMHKYKYLNNEDAHKKDVAYNAKNIATKYIFQRSSLDIFYLVCDTIDEFYAYYSAKRPCSRMYNEVINDGFSAQKFKLDIDGRIGANEMKYVLKVMRRIFRKLTRVKPEILVYDISTSHHIIVANICFPSAACCEMLANAICEKVFKRYPTESSLIDTTVYKKVQMFRIEGSTKYGQRRWKYATGFKELSSLEIFKKGIVSYVDECYHVEKDRVIDVMLDTDVYQPIEHEFKRKNGAKVIPRGFVVRKKMDDLIVLDRITSSFCDICKRVHDSENAYIIGSTFFCRRADN
jgi:hypothetical protein